MADMATTGQLYRLQEIDLEIESLEKALHDKSCLLGARQELDRAGLALEEKKQRLVELKKKQSSLEDDIEDLGTKISSAEGQLYGGKVNNPKELSSLQHEVTLLKGKRDQKETEALELMDRVEAAASAFSVSETEFQKLEQQWRQQQEQLKTEIARIKESLAALKKRRDSTAAEIDAPSLESYEFLRRQKGQAVAKVGQGICHACRISLSSSQLQHVRSGTVAYCGSCGRILYLP